MNTKETSTIPFLVNFISKYVQLNKRNNQWWGCCPFHEEKTPSFYVSETNFHCFGCKEEGTTPQDFMYILKKHNLKPEDELINSKINKEFSIIEDSIDLAIACFDNLIAKGEIYLAELDYCETEQHRKEIIDDCNDWIEEVKRFIQMLKNENPMKISAQQIKDNTTRSVIQERITLFENIVLNNFLPTIDQYLQDVHKDAEKSKINPEVWKILSASLKTERNKIVNLKNEVIQIFSEDSGEKNA